MLSLIAKSKQAGLPGSGRKTRLAMMVSGKPRWKRNTVIGAAAVSAFLAYYIFCLPAKIFDVPYSTVLLDSAQNLLGASISSDGQWRFPLEQQIPGKFKDAITLFEDHRFYYHPGVDPLAFVRAGYQNITAGKVVSGGSTISMQVIRLSRRNRGRTLWNKGVELLLATRLEWRYSKDEILALYAAHTPFGGNVVGLEAACWRYFGRRPDDLSWAEASLLAVLPNNPSLIHLSRNRGLLLEKRNRLLARLHAGGKLDSLTLQLALSEAIPEKPLRLPSFAPHLLVRAIREGKSQQRIQTTINGALQERVSAVVWGHHEKLRGNQIFNAAALVLDVETGSAVAYIGNVPAGEEHHQQVDVVNSARSTGSILKPFLFAAMLDEGKLLRKSLVPDVPMLINGFSPKNFSRDYDGAVAADEALIRSLNIPAVHELRDYRYEKFHKLLERVGILPSHAADHYGLSLILGGAEASLWEITGAYASMARTLTGYFEHPGLKRYEAHSFRAPQYIKSEGTQAPLESHSALSAAAIWQTMETLKEVYRPGEETGWRLFQSSKRIAWKTGTSFGFRDGWAVGVTPRYAVGVWIGNADGEGRPGLTGTETAAPVMFDIFSILPGHDWFERPASEMVEVKACGKSGFLASPSCPGPEDVWTTPRGASSRPCIFHKKVHLTGDKKYRVHSACERVDRIVSESWFVLPPMQEHYYKTRHAAYRPLPPLRGDCPDPSTIPSMELIYPKPESKIFVPRQLDGSGGSTVFQVAHRDPAAVVYWHLDGRFLGSTRTSHRLLCVPAEGIHHITLVDQEGEIVQKSFNVISSR